METWTIRDVANAFNFKDNVKDSTDRKVVIPIFQRGLRWDPQRRRAFIDSLEKGYPFGSLLFAKQDGINKYSVVDGLQRGSTVCDYVFNPLGKDNITSIDDEVLDAVREAIYPGNRNHSINKEIEKLILDYLHEQKQFEKINPLKLTALLMKQFPNTQQSFELAQELDSALQPFLDEKRKKYNTICGSPAPIVVYSGPQELLSEIFNRINTKGIALNDYEIYSATWDQKKFVINDVGIVDNVIKKYWTLADAGFEIDGFDATVMRTTKELTAFEFLFGLGKLWTEKYDCLKFESKGKDDEISEVSFEIVDACLNDVKSISKLDKRLKEININKLKRRIEEAIVFVSNSINVIGSFKGNKRKFTVLHSKYQIISMISYTFRSMYDTYNLDRKKDSWNTYQDSFEKSLLEHYVADIITNEWHDGGAQKVYSFNRDRRYDEGISQQRWGQILDNYYLTQLQNRQRDRFNNPVNADSVILNCIYVGVFTAQDHLSNKKFDIEHLATKERMKTIMNKFIDLKLPVSCIANYCYLPEDINRGKKDKTIYEATGLSLPISEIESKFSFTVEGDFKWISYPYADDEQSVLEKNYRAFLNMRYDKMKEKFLKFFES